MTTKTTAGGSGLRARKAFFVSTSAAAVLAAGLCISESATAQSAAPAASTLPPVQVDAPGARVRRAQPKRAATNRAARPQRAVQAQPLRQPLSVSSQDARTGQVGYITTSISSGTKTNTPLVNVPQSVSVLTKEFIRDQDFRSIGEAVRYVPGVVPHQGEGNRDDLVIRGQRTNADFFIDGVRDDVQYFRDLYNTQRIEVLKGPNAMIFGRGGGGGVINRVQKEADGVPIREVTVQGGSYDNKRVTVDTGGAVNENVAARINAMYENSGSYRDFLRLERYGINPTVTVRGEDTSVKLSYEYLHDDRTADRGIPAQNSGFTPTPARPTVPVNTSPSTFFGNPDQSYSKQDVHIANAVIDHDFNNGLTVKNSSRYANYDKFYQNVFPTTGTFVTPGGIASISAYNNLVQRENLFNQTDWTYRTHTGPIKHTITFGTEFGQQNTFSLRNSGVINGNSATLSVPASNPTTFAPWSFVHNNASDNNAYATLNLASAYVQDQIEFNRYLQFIGGVRYDRFDLTATNLNPGGTRDSRVDNLVSPRAGVIVKPVDNVSIYGSYSISYLPSAGDQFSSLTPSLAVTVPEKFINNEVGVKWDINPRLQAAVAVYDLDRENQRFIQNGLVVAFGKTNTKGAELSLTGYLTDQWQVTGGYAYTDSRIVDASSATILAGNRVGLVPYNTFTMWNKYQFTEMWGAGLGLIHYDNFFATSDDTVRLKAFTRVDAAVYFRLDKTWRGQLNIENLFDTRYYATADAPNNITPGSPRAFRASVTASF